MRRDGQFYMLDAFFAAAILFLGIGLLVSEFVSTPQQRQTQVATQDASSLLFTQTIGDLDNEYIRSHYGILEEAFTPAQQVHFWLYNTTRNGCTWCLDEAGNLTESILAGILGPQHGVQVVMDTGSAQTIYTRQSPLPDAVLMIATRQIITTPWNESETVGPDMMEVRIWE